jgi:hypothetical protein
MRQRIDHLVGYADLEHIQDERQNDDETGENEEDHRRVRHLVADPLDAVEQPLQQGRPRSRGASVRPHRGGLPPARRRRGRRSRRGSANREAA